MPLPIRVRRMLPGVTRLRRGDAPLDDVLLVSESRLSVRARVLGLLSRPDMGVVHLDQRANASRQSTVCRDAIHERAWPCATRDRPSPTLLRVLSQNEVVVAAEALRKSF